MLEISPYLVQFRSREHTYLFKPAQALNRVIVDIFDRNAKHLESREIFLDKIVNIAPHNNLQHVLRSLLGKKYRIDHQDKNLFVPKQHAPFSDFDMAAYEKSSKKAEVVLASKISSPNQHDDLICPISQEPFRDPVMDNHGHNFEKESI
ncbi:MAG: hypothetical protein WB791_02570, partial [Waddliaceae bacterium]